VVWPSPRAPSSPCAPHPRSPSVSSSLSCTAPPPQLSLTSASAHLSVSSLPLPLPPPTSISLSMVEEDNVLKAVRRGVASDYRLTLRRLKREARRSLMNFKKIKTEAQSSR